MTKKLSQICRDLKKEFYGNYKDNAERRIGFEDGFKAAIESDEVQALVEVLEYFKIINDDLSYVAFQKNSEDINPDWLQNFCIDIDKKIDEALADFEGE